MIEREGNHLNIFPRFDSVFASISNTAINDKKRYLFFLSAIVVFIILVLSLLQLSMDGYESSLKLFGLPIISIGDNAYGLIAIGGFAKGFVAFGGVAVGFVAFGGVSIGILSFGGLGFGLVTALGGASFGFYSFGGFSVGAFSYAGGGVAKGYYKASGQQSESLFK